MMCSSRKSVVLMLILALSFVPASASLAAKPCEGNSASLDPTDCTVWQQFYDMNSPGGNGHDGWYAFCNGKSGFTTTVPDYYRTDPCMCKVPGATPGDDWTTGIFCEEVSGQLHLTRMYLIYTSPKLQATQNASDPLSQQPQYAFPPDLKKMRALNSLFLAGNKLRGLLPELDYSQYHPGVCISNAGTQFCCELGGGENMFACPWPKGALDNCYSPSEARIMQNKMWCGYCAPGAGADATGNPQTCASCRQGEWAAGYTPHVLGNSSDPAPKSGAAQCAMCECPTGYGCPAASISSTKNCVECAAGKHSSQHGTPVTPDQDYCADCACPPGQDSPQTGQATCNCVGCPAGKFGTGGSKLCEICPAGKHQPAKNKDSCPDCSCSVGQASNATGVASALCPCKACPRGSYGAGDDAQCLKCVPGKFSPDPSTPCDTCPVGKYSDATLNPSCSDAQCPPGDSSSTAGATSPTADCEQCPAGKYGMGKAEACRSALCPAGRYTPKGSSDPTAQCLNCPSGQNSAGGDGVCVAVKAASHLPAEIGGAVGAVAAFALLFLFLQRRRRNARGQSFGKWFYRPRNRNGTFAQPLLTGETDVYALPNRSDPRQSAPRMDEPQTIVISADDRALSWPALPQERTSTTAQVKSFTAAQLKQATSNFADHAKLDEGTFGAVYRGKLSDGVAIAVKVMKRSKQAASGSTAQSKYSGAAQFQRETEVLGKYRHPNIVALLGSCIGEGDGDLAPSLVYEFMSGASLKTRLKARLGTEPLSWKDRLVVARDVASALNFLHSVRPPVVHQDVKSANVLLGTEGTGRRARLVAKLADFGTVRVAPTLIDATHMSTKNIVGTPAYMAPEVIQAGQISGRTDAFAFGVILLELLTGKPPSDPVTKETLFNSMTLALDDIERMLPPLLDTRATPSGWRLEPAFALARVAVQMIEPRAHNRANVSDVRADLDHVWRQEQTFTFRSRDVAQYVLGQKVSGLGPENDVSGFVVKVVTSTDQQSGKITVGHYYPQPHL